MVEFRQCRADALPGPQALRLLGAEDLEAAWELIGDSLIRQASGGLYEVWWQWRRLTKNRLAAHIAAGQVWGIDLEGRLAAPAIVLTDPEGEHLPVGYLDGSPEGLRALAWGLRLLAHQHGCQGVRVFSVESPALLDAFRSASIVPHREHSLYIFEKLMKGD